MILSKLDLFYNQKSADKDNHYFVAQASVDSTGTLITFPVSQDLCKKIEALIVQEASDKIGEIVIKDAQKQLREALRD